MKTQKTLSQSLLIVAIVTAGILSVPLVAMQFTTEVDWGLFDFIIMGALIFGTGAGYVLIARSSSNIMYKAAFGLAFLSTFLLIWTNLAVGLIGAGANPGNLMYMGVVAVAIIGSILSRFSASGMERAMYSTAAALVAVAVIALLAKMDQYPESSVAQIIGVNMFFAILFGMAAALFHNAAQAPTTN